MRKVVVLAVLVAVATVGAGVASGSASRERADAWSVGGWTVPSARATSQRIAADETIVLVGRVTRFRYVDLGREGESVGDFFLIREALVDGRGNRVGRQVYRCMLQFLPDLQCDGSNVLRGRGQVTFATIVDTSNKTIPPAPITGGSGEFANVGGQMLIEFRGDRNVYTLQILRFD